MSFVCDTCKKAQPNKSTPHKVVVATRAKVYQGRRVMKDEFFVEEPGGTGTEIVKEISICDGCLQKRK